MGSGIGTPVAQSVSPVAGAFAKLRIKLESVEAIAEMLENRLSSVTVLSPDQPEVPGPGKIQPACSAMTTELEATATRLGRVVERLEKLHNGLEL